MKSNRHQVFELRKNKNNYFLKKFKKKLDTY